MKTPIARCFLLWYNETNNFLTIGVEIVNLATTMYYLISSKQKKEMIGLINQNVQMKRMYEDAKRILATKTEEKNRTVAYFDTKEYARMVEQPLQEFLKNNPTAAIKEKEAKELELNNRYKVTKSDLLKLYETDFERDTNLYRQIVRDQECRQERINKIKQKLNLKKPDEAYCTLTKQEIASSCDCKELTK